MSFINIQLLSAPRKEFSTSGYSYAPDSYFHCHLLFYSASLEHHSAFLPVQETLSSHFSNMHFFPFNKILACLTVFLEHRVRSSCYFFPAISSKIYHMLLYSRSLHHFLSSLARNDYKYASWSNS